MRTILPLLLLLTAFPTSGAIRPWEAKITFVNFEKTEEEKVRAAVALIKKVIASDEFRSRVLNYAVAGKKGFVDNRGYSNEEIYQKIFEGAEIIGDTSKDGTMNVELELFHSPTKTIGYTFPDTTRIWVNRRYFNDYTPLKVADNLMHEWMHKLGFDHARERTPEREHSVPYAIGYLIEELGARLPALAQTLQ